MSTDWIKYKRFGWPDGSKVRALSSLGCSSVSEAVEKAKALIKDPLATQVSTIKQPTQCKPLEQPEKEWVLFVSWKDQTFYVEELKE